jgi:hypothetical protein
LTGIVDTDAEIIANMSLGDIISLYNTNQNMRQLLNNAHVLRTLRNKYLLPPLSDFRDFIHKLLDENYFYTDKLISENKKDELLEFYQDLINYETVLMKIVRDDEDLFIYSYPDVWNPDHRVTQAMTEAARENKKNILYTLINNYPDATNYYYLTIEAAKHGNKELAYELSKKIDNTNISNYDVVALGAAQGEQHDLLYDIFSKQDEVDWRALINLFRTDANEDEIIFAAKIAHEIGHDDLADTLESLTEEYW